MLCVENKISVLLTDGNQIILDNASENALKIADYFKEEKVEAIHSSEPNLENIFMMLTGRGLE